MHALSIAEAQEIDTSVVPDIHAYLAGLRTNGPIARSKMGLIVALRHQHLDLITRDITRQIETEGKLIQGIISGPIFDFIKSSMLFSNGDVHLRRRAPVSRTFAFKLMDAMRPKAAALATELVQARIGPGPIDFVMRSPHRSPPASSRTFLAFPAATSQSSCNGSPIQLKRSASSILTVVMRSRRALWRSTTMLRRYWLTGALRPEKIFCRNMSKQLCRMENCPRTRSAPRSSGSIQRAPDDPRLIVYDACSSPPTCGSMARSSVPIPMVSSARRWTKDCVSIR